MPCSASPAGRRGTSSDAHFRSPRSGSFVENLLSVRRVAAPMVALAVFSPAIGVCRAETQSGI
ncbi:hypothetical protein PXNS11_310171 [Stutzerimonas xanthomarina]|nr:hypothetical protein PXNS11_310171 [Stutzerimonas xanthomarina]